MTPVLALLLTIGMVVGLPWLFRGLWILFLWLTSVALEGERAGEQVLLIRRRLQYTQDLLAAKAKAEREAQRRRVTDLDGHRQMMGLTELRVFRRECCRELGAELMASEQEIRKLWRRSVIKWHPDQGGDAEGWLRKLRAYEAIKQLER